MNSQTLAKARTARNTNPPVANLSPRDRRVYLSAHLAFFLRELNKGHEIAPGDLAALMPFCSMDAGEAGATAINGGPR